MATRNRHALNLKHTPEECCLDWGGKRVETGLGLEFKDQTWQDQRKDLTWYFTFKELTSTWDKGLETGLGTALKRLDSDLSSKIRLDIDLGRKT